MSEKLSKFNHVGGLKADFNVILNNLDRIFTVSADGVDELINFLEQHNFDKFLSYHLSYYEDDPSLKIAAQNHALATELKAEYLQLNKKRNYTADKLPFNYTNQNWLAHYILTFVKNIEPQTRLTHERVKRFLKNPNCEQAVANFESKLTKELIKQEMVNFEGGKYIYPRQRLFVNEYEEIFRTKVIYAMDFLGADLHNVELTVEGNANLWRRQTMIRGFEEFHYPKEEEPEDFKLNEKWHEIREKHLKAHLRVKEFNYFRRYRSIIEEAGSVAENMGMGYFGYLHAHEDCAKYDYKRLKILNEAAKLKQNNNDKNID